MGAQAQNSGLFRTDAYLSIERGSVLRWKLNSDRLVDSLRMVYGLAYAADIGDSLDAELTTGARKIPPGKVAANGVTDGYVLTASSGVATWSTPTAGGWDVDSAAAMMTVGPRKLNLMLLDDASPPIVLQSVLTGSAFGGGKWSEFWPWFLSIGAMPDTLDTRFTVGPVKLTTSLLQPGTDGDVLITAAGVPFWTADPGLARGASQFFYWTSILAQTATDTASDKHVAYCGYISREWPVPHGTTFSAISAALFVRSGTFATYSANMTTVGSGATAVTQGDRFLMRFFPGGGTGTDKYVKLYRIPSTYAWMGGTAGVNKRYGEYIGYWLVPAASFPASGTVNLECTLSLKVK